MGRYASALHFHATLAAMLGSTLIRHQVVQVCEPREKRLLASLRMMEPFHGEQFPLDGGARLSSLYGEPLITGPIVWLLDVLGRLP